MHPSFAQFPGPLYALVLVLASGGCATLPAPTAELSAAQQAVSRADGVDADQHAAELIAQAREELAQAQAAMARGRDNEARDFAVLAAADADLAHARSREAVANQELARRRGEIAALRRQLQLEDGR